MQIAESVYVQTSTRQNSGDRGLCVYLTQVSRLYVEVIQHLLAEHPDAFHGTKLGDRVQLTSDPATLRQSTQVAESYFVEGNIDSKTKFERMKIVLTELGLEDDLFVKFA